MSHLGFIRGFSYSKTDFICTLFRWIMHGYPVATLQHGISDYEFRWSAKLGVRGRSKWVKSGLYGSIGLVRRGKQHGVTLLWWYLLLIHCNVGTCASRFLIGGIVSRAYFIVQELLWFAKRMKVKSLVVVCCGMIFRSWRSLFFSIGCVHLSYAEAGMDLI